MLQKTEKKFLVVDDDSDDSGLFAEALSSVGKNNVFYSAADGQDALEKLENRLIDIPDMIFLDINMPVMNGWECLAKLKSREKYQQIPVIIYTTSSRSVDRVIAKDLGAICLFTKLHDFKKIPEKGHLLRKF